MLDELESQPRRDGALEHLEGTISTLLQRSDSAHAARDAVVVRLWHRVVHQEQDLTAAVHQLVGVCAALTERLETQHREQQQLVDVIRVLGQKLELSSNRAPTKLIGGTVFPTEPAASDADVIELEASQTDPETSEGQHDGEGWHAAR